MGSPVAKMVVGSAATLALAFGGPRAARGADEPCATVQAARDLPPPWADAVKELERQLAQVPASECQRQTLSIELGEGGARVLAVASDGRRAERTVRKPAALTATALGLVMSIPPEGSAGLAAPLPAPSAAPPAAPAASPTTASTAAGAPAPPAPAAAVDATPAPTSSSAFPAFTGSSAAAPPPTTPPSTAVWVGVGLGGRLAAPGSITMADIEARIDVLLGHWLLFASIRDVPVGLQSSQGIESDPYRELGVGIGAGRRFRLGTTALDVGLEPALAVMRMEVDLPQPQPSGQEDVSGTDVELRIGAFARLWLPLGPSWALTVTADTDVMPNNLVAPDRIDLPPGVVTNEAIPPFPAWTGGLRLGVEGELL
jgi:hypothetical protein